MSTVIRQPKFDADFAVFCTTTIPMIMRYDVLLHDKEMKPYLGKVITHTSIESWCKTHGYELSVCTSKGPARKGEKTELS